DEGGLVVGYCDFPGNAVGGKSKTLFDLYTKEVLPQLGKIVSERDFTVQGNPAREVQLNGKGESVKVRLILVGNRLYQVTAGGKPSLISDKDVQTFMDSFKFTR